ncbi:protein kinase activating protein dpb11 [Coemansia sp. S146]|nr:protein kinase activating protein dpb11 [Coemansia sp. S146]
MSIDESFNWVEAECELEARDHNREPGLQPGAHSETTDSDIAEVLRQITGRTRFPPFTGCCISSTGFPFDLRAEIERLVENACLASTCLFSKQLADGLSNRPSLGSEQVGGGGLYCGVLTSDCTHLIAQSPDGEKFKFAKSRAIHVVSLEWFVQCLLTGARQNEDNYTVEYGDQSALTTVKTPAVAKLQRLQSLGQARQKSEASDSSTSGSRGYRKHASAPISERTLSASSVQSGIPPTIDPATSSGILQQSGLVASRALNRSCVVGSGSEYADSFDLPPNLIEPLKVDSEEDIDVVAVVDRPAASVSRLRPPQPRPSRASSAVFESCRIALSRASLSPAHRDEWGSKIVAACGECISEDSTPPSHATDNAHTPQHIDQWTHYVVGDSDKLCAEDICVLQLTHATEKLARPLVVQCGWLRECWRTGRRAKEATYSIPWPEPSAESSLSVAKDLGVSLARPRQLPISGSSVVTRHTTKPQLSSPSMVGRPLGNSTMDNDKFDFLANTSNGNAKKRGIASSDSADDEQSSDVNTKHPRRLVGELVPGKVNRRVARGTLAVAASSNSRLADGGSSPLHIELSAPSQPSANCSRLAICNPQTIYTVDSGDSAGGGGVSLAVFARCVFTSLGLAAPAAAKFKQAVRENGGTYVDVFGSFPSIASHQPRTRAQVPYPSIDWMLNALASNIDDMAVTDAYIVIPLRGIDELATCEAALRRYPSMHIVTECWVDQCVHDNLRYPDYHAIQALRLPYPGLSAGQHIAFRPLKSTRIADAGSLSLSISGYEGAERDHIGRLARALGIEYSERLPRKTTHLICRRPFSGQKYERALKWGLQVVDSTWFYDLVVAGQVDNIGTGEEGQKTATLGAPTAISNGRDIATTPSSATCSIKQMTTPLTKSTHQSLLLGTPGRTPMDVSLERNIQQALGNNRVRIRLALGGEDDGDVDNDVDVDVDNDATQMSPTHLHNGAWAVAVSNDDGDLASVLEGAVIAISSRLLYRREELTELAQRLGGRVLPRFDVKEATHLVHQSNRERETLRDYQLALQNKIHVVSPWWLYECRDTMTAVPEDNFPYTYNRDRRLMLVSTSQAPPKQQLAEGLVARVSSSRWQISPSQGRPLDAKGKSEYSVYAAASLVDTTNPGLLPLQELSSASATDTREIGSLFGKKADSTRRRYRLTMDGVERFTSGDLAKEIQAQSTAISNGSTSTSSGDNVLDRLEENRCQPVKLQELQPHSASAIPYSEEIVSKTGSSIEDAYLTLRHGSAEAQTPDKWWLSVDPVASARYAPEFQASLYSQEPPPDDCHRLDSIPCTNAPANDVDSCTSSRTESLGPHVRPRSANASASSRQLTYNTTIVYGEDAEALSERDRLIQRLIGR